MANDPKTTEHTSDKGRSSVETHENQSQSSTKKSSPTTKVTPANDWLPEGFTLMDDDEPGTGFIILGVDPHIKK